MNGPIFVDVDGTMTDAGGSAWGNPKKSVIDAVRAAIGQGIEVVVWSARGRKYCLEFCKKHNIKPIACVGKPNTLVDDFVERHGKGFRDDWRMLWLTPEAFAGHEVPAKPRPPRRSARKR